MRTSTLQDVGDRDGWRCWVCDGPVDPDRSVNDDRGPSVDGLTAHTKSSRGRADAAAVERLAHRACNSRKGAVAVEIPWPAELFVVEPAPLLAVAERLRRKAGREVVARCPGADDAEQTAAWLTDRFQRLTPGLAVTADVRPGGGAFLVAVVRER